jgi:hypothetical protein
VDVPRVTGQPYEEPRGQAGRLHESVNALRRSIDTYDLPDETIRPRPFAELAGDAKRISGLGQHAKFAQIGAELPGLLDELSTALYQASEGARTPLYGLLAEAYSGASTIANLLGSLPFAPADRAPEASCAGAKRERGCAVPSRRRERPLGAALNPYRKFSQPSTSTSTSTSTVRHWHQPSAY